MSDEELEAAWAAIERFFADRPRCTDSEVCFALRTLGKIVAEELHSTDLEAIEDEADRAREDVPVEELLGIPDAWAGEELPF